MDITINGKNVTLKKTFRSVIAYEQAMGKSFNPQTITETVMYFYCVIIASDQSVEITFDEFLNWLDENPTAIKDFTDWLIKQTEIESKLTKKKSTKASQKEK